MSINLMINNPGITIEEIVDKIGKDRNAVNYQLKKTKTYIKIERIGSDKKGVGNISLPWNLKVEYGFKKPIKSYIL